MGVRDGRVHGIEADDAVGLRDVDAFFGNAGRYEQIRGVWCIATCGVVQGRVGWWQGAA